MNTTISQPADVTESGTAAIDAVVLAVLDERPGMDAEEITDLLGLPFAIVDDAVERLLNRGSLGFAGGGAA